ncbi:MAG TPA: CHASE2 domain-containing protein [Xanthomonadaceae bacterium]|jgi:CHASE2 domain-containing sensor protein
MANQKQAPQHRPSPMQVVARWFNKPVDAWGRAFGRASTAIASRFRYNFFLMLTIAALLFLYWDLVGFGNWDGRQIGGFKWLSSVENSLFDFVIANRPIDPPTSNRVVIAEIDECSIAYFEKKGQTGWPWPRDRHADLLTALGDSGVAAVGYDVLFLDKQTTQSESDDMLLQVAKLGAPAVFGARLDAATPETSTDSTADRWPTAKPLSAKAGQAPRVDMQLPYGAAMRERAGFVNITRSGDGVVRDFDVWKPAGGWAVPSMAALLAAQVTHRPFTAFPQSIRVNWHANHRLPVVSAVDLMPDEHTPCLKPGQKLPDLKGRIVLVGYVASGINDYKPTPIDKEMEGVKLHGEVVENLVDGTWIRMPDDRLKYALSAVLVTLIGLSFWRGESARDIDAVFTVTNLVLTAAAILSLTFTDYFIDVFTSIGISLTFFGLCRTYLAGMKGRALGSDDHVPELGHKGRLHVVLLLLRVSVGKDLTAAGRNPEARRFWERNEYRRRIRRMLYAHGYAKIHEGLIERKTFLASDFRDVILMVCDAPTVEELRWEIVHDLKLISEELARIADETRLEQIVTASAAYVDLSELDQATRAISLQNTLGKVLQMPATTSLRAFLAADVECLPRYVYPSAQQAPNPGEPPCAMPSES